VWPGAAFFSREDFMETPTSDAHARERVVTADLAIILRRWIDAWEAERHNDYLGNNFKPPKYEHEMSPVGVLSFETGINPRRIWAITNEENRTTSLWMADRLLSAMGKEHLLRTGEIRILEDYSYSRQTPMSQEEWQAFLQERGNCVD
jgi:hypothetical protein